MAFTTIQDSELVGMGVTGLPDTPELSTDAMQAQFDEYPQFLKDKFKTHITELEANTAASDIGMEIPSSLTNIETEKVQAIVDEIASRVQTQKEWQDAADLDFSPAQLNTNAFHADDTDVTVPTVDTSDSSTKAASTENVDNKIDAFDDTLTTRIAGKTFAGTVGATVPNTLPDTTQENTQAVLNAIAAEAHANTAWRTSAESAFETDDLKTDAFHATNENVYVPTMPTTDNSQNAASTAYVQENMAAASLGDMRKVVYDPDDNGYVDEAKKLHTGRNIQVDLTSGSAASFDGSANVTPGVSGILPVSHGGTGLNDLDDLPISSATQSALDGKAPNDHSSENTTYGLGNSTEYGHLKLSDSTSSSSDSTGGVAATPKAVKRANDTATATLSNEGNVEISSIAASSHAVGDYIVYGTSQQFAHVDSPISPGNTIVDGGNVTNMNIGDVLTSLNSALATQKASYSYTTDTNGSVMLYIDNNKTTKANPQYTIIDFVTITDSNNNFVGGIPCPRGTDYLYRAISMVNGSTLGNATLNVVVEYHSKL